MSFSTTKNEVKMLRHSTFISFLLHVIYFSFSLFVWFPPTILLFIFYMFYFWSFPWKVAFPTKWHNLLRAQYNLNVSTSDFVTRGLVPTLFLLRLCRSVL